MTSQRVDTTSTNVSDVHAQWFIRERGITSATLSAFGVHSMPDGSVVYPYPAGPKLRYGLPDGKREFRYPRGLAVDFFRPQEADRSAPITGKVLVCEGETDTMRQWQELHEQGYGDRYTVVGIPGVDSWTERMAEQLRGADVILVFLDNDPPPSRSQQADGYTLAQVDRSWQRMRRSLGAKVKRVNLQPSGCKDLCEFFQRFGLDDMKGLIDRPPEFHYAGINFRNQEPIAVDWLVEGLMGKGDRVMMIGEPGGGKSWLAMALAVAIATLGTGQDARWLGIRPAITTGRVLYVDEENPESEVYRRMQLLGLTESAAENVRYLSQVGVRLDEHPEQLLDDVIELRPDLVILDSLARVHGRDEQNAGEMGRLFRDGITPLARESGAAVLALHHKTKPQKGSVSGFQSARGSGDLTASIDQGLDVLKEDHGSIKIEHYKARRSTPHPWIRAMICDEDGKVRVNTI